VIVSCYLAVFFLQVLEMEQPNIGALQPENVNNVSVSDVSEDLTDGLGISDSAVVLDEPSDMKIEEMGQKSDEILNEAEKMEISMNDVGVECVGKDVKEVNENVTRVGVESDEKDVKEVNDNGTQDDPIPCFYCDELSFDVKDTESYKTHLREVHSVKKNLDVLAELTIKTQHGGDGYGHLDCVSPEPLEAKEPAFSLPENLSDFESDDDDDMFGSKEDEIPDTETKEEVVPVAKEVAEDVLKADEGEAIKDSAELDIPAGEVDELLREGEESPMEETPCKEDSGGQASKVLEEKSQQEEPKPKLNDENGLEDVDKDDDQDTLTLEIGKQDEFEIPPEDEEKDKKDDALSDLSLSDDDFDQSNADWVVLDEANSEDKENKVEESKSEPSEASSTCSKCDTAHKVGSRCSFILRNSKPTIPHSRTVKRDRGEYSGGRPREPEYRKPREKIRTLPPELYNNPNDYERRAYRRSRSPRRRPPTPPFEREGYEDRRGEGYEDRRDRRPRDAEDRRLYEKKYDDLYTTYSRSEDKVERKSCKLCSSTSHLVKNCPDLFCYKCEHQGHFAKECPNPNTSRKSKPHTSDYSSTQPGTFPQPSYNYSQQMTPPTINQTPSMQMTHPPPNVSYTSPSYGVMDTYPVPPSVPPSVTDHLPSNYAESLHSLQPLQLFMSAKMMSMPGQSYPKTYIDLLVTNVGKMLAQANLGLQALLTAFSTKGDSFVRALISKELAVYAERFPGGVNMPLITHTTIEYLISQGGGMQHFPYPAQ